MKGDFSRFTFDPHRRFRGVRMQQGRVQIDADWNEQIDILNHFLTIQLSDLLGAGGAPQGMESFKISLPDETQNRADKQVESETDADKTLRLRTDSTRSKGPHETPLDFFIERGRYYVDGIMCENDRKVLFSAQPDYPRPHMPELKHHALAYLDVWERHVTAFEDATLREVALGGIDTSTRVKTIWQVKLLPLDEHAVLRHGESVTREDIVELPEWRELVHRPGGKTLLTARHVMQSSALDNLLYRVEIHQAHAREATFKWSRENGSVVFEVEHLSSYEKNKDGTATCIVTLSDLGRDTSQLQKGDWLEFTNEWTVLHNHTLPLYQVIGLSTSPTAQVTLSGEYADTLEALAKDPSGTLLLRRWDSNPANPAAQKHGTLRGRRETWIDLERGIQVRFSEDGTYRVGDYWLIPSRSLLDDIEWPADEHGPQPVKPRDNHHHYSPLALLHFHSGLWTVAKDLRRSFAPLPMLTERSRQPTVIEIDETKIEEPAPGNRRNALFEECTSEDELEPGDVVSLVPGSDRQVTRASRENAGLVSGVVTDVFEANGNRRFRVTIYGRACCKVVGPVEAGALLTPARVKGCAVATEPLHEFFRPGSLLGKALASHTPDESDAPALIEIMVTLQ